MLFNTFNFLFVFLPIVLIIAKIIKKYDNENFLYIFLIFSSLYFYSYNFPKYLFLIIFSITFNFIFSKVLIRIKEKKFKFAVFIIALSINILLLMYYKYFNFILNNVNSLLGLEFINNDIRLPLAISFFTFQQIAFITSVYKNDIKKFKLVKYFLYISFFPQLIAGPIVKFNEFNPYLKKKNWNNILSNNYIKLGLIIFSIGMFKKIVISNYLASISDPLFFNINNNIILNTTECWVALLTFSLQIYYDFSGYTDMAIGLALCFAIRLPINFYSPYKATSINKFWKKWHITLSRFLREHIYIPLGGNKKGKIKTISNIFITMLLGGIWHGASWNFLIWGGYHAVLISIEKYIIKVRIFNKIADNKALCKLLVFFLVTLGWIPFRCQDFNTTVIMLKTLFLFDESISLFNSKINLFNMILISIILSLVFVFPNTYQIQKWIEEKSKNNTNINFLLLLFVIVKLSIIFVILATPSSNINREFIYFQF